MSEGYRSSSGGVHIDPDTFSNALERIASDEGLRKQLSSSPVETLQSLGIRVDSQQRAQLAATRLAEATGEGDAALFVAPVVRVATSPVVRVAVSVAVATEVDQPLKQLSRKRKK